MTVWAHAFRHSLSPCAVLRVPIGTRQLVQRAPCCHSALSGRRQWPHQRMTAGLTSRLREPRAIRTGRVSHMQRLTRRPGRERPQALPPLPCPQDINTNMWQMAMDLLRWKLVAVEMLTRLAPGAGAPSGTAASGIDGGDSAARFRDDPAGGRVSRTNVLACAHAQQWHWATRWAMRPRLAVRTCGRLHAHAASLQPPATPVHEAAAHPLGRTSRSESEGRKRHKKRQKIERMRTCESLCDRMRGRQVDGSSSGSSSASASAASCAACEPEKKAGISWHWSSWHRGLQRRGSQWRRRTLWRVLSVEGGPSHCPAGQGCLLMLCCWCCVEDVLMLWPLRSTRMHCVKPLPFLRTASAHSAAGSLRPVPQPCTPGFAPCASGAQLQPRCKSASWGPMPADGKRTTMLSWTFPVPHVEPFLRQCLSPRDWWGSRRCHPGRMSPATAGHDLGQAAKDKLKRQVSKKILEQTWPHVRCRPAIQATDVPTATCKRALCNAEEQPEHAACSMAASTPAPSSDMVSCAS